MATESGRPAKKVRLLSDDEDSSSGSDSDASAAEIIDHDESSAFKVNSEYAKRFEHNKKREELQRCE